MSAVHDRPVARSDFDGAELYFCPARVSAAGVDCVGRSRPNTQGKQYLYEGSDYNKAKMNYVLRCLRKGELHALPQDIMERVMNETLP